MYVDDCVIVLKKDGKNNELFLLANANRLPTLDILGYLSSKVNLLSDNPLNTISKASECSMYTVKKGNNSIKDAKVFFGDQIIKEGVLFENGYIYDIVPNQIIQARDGVVFNIFEKISKTSNNGENLEIYVSGSRVSKGDFVFINGVKANDGAYKTGVFSSMYVAFEKGSSSILVVL